MYVYMDVAVRNSGHKMTSCVSSAAALDAGHYTGSVGFTRLHLPVGRHPFCSVFRSFCAAVEKATLRPAAIIVRDANFALDLGSI